MNALELIRAATEPKQAHSIVDAFEALGARIGDSTKMTSQRGYQLELDYYEGESRLLITAVTSANPNQRFQLDAASFEESHPALDVEIMLRGHKSKLTTLHGDVTADELLKKLLQMLFAYIETHRPGRAHAAAEPNQALRVTPTDLFEFTNKDRGAVRAVFPAGTAELLCYEHDEQDGTAEFEVNVHPHHGDDDWDWNIGCGFVNLKFDARKRLIHMDAIAEKKSHAGLKKVYPWLVTLTPAVLMRAILRDLNAAHFLESVVKVNT